MTGGGGEPDLPKLLYKITCACYFRGCNAVVGPEKWGSLGNRLKAPSPPPPPHPDLQWTVGHLQLNPREKQNKCPVASLSQGCSRARVHIPDSR